ncbi:MAG: hypothetical protein KGK34_12910, partial [Chloroflexota bacterium]|nr:hypothetical protein [Chloroflexota bacterium]
MSEHDDHDDQEHDGERHHEGKHRHKGEIVQLTEASKPTTVTSSFLEMVESAKDVMTVRRVYGEPIEKDGVTIIPAATVRGGGGGGMGEGPRGQGGGWGGGFATTAKPAGAFVIKDGVVKWSPAIDVNRTIVGGQIATIFFLL